MHWSNSELVCPGRASQLVGSFLLALAGCGAPSRSAPPAGHVPEKTWATRRPQHVAPTVIPAEPHAAPVRAATLSPAGILAATWTQRELRIWDVRSASVRCQLAARGPAQAPDGTAALSPDEAPPNLAFDAKSRLLFIGRSNGMLQSIRTEDCRVHQERRIGSHPVAVAVGTDFVHAASGSNLLTFRGDDLQNLVERWEAPRGVHHLTTDRTGSELGLVFTDFEELLGGALRSVGKADTRPLQPSSTYFFREAGMVIDDRGRLFALSISEDRPSVWRTWASSGAQEAPRTLRQRADHVDGEDGHDGSDEHEGLATRSVPDRVIWVDAVPDFPGPPLGSALAFDSTSQELLTPTSSLTSFVNVGGSPIRSTRTDHGVLRLPMEGTEGRRTSLRLEIETCRRPHPILWAFDGTLDPNHLLYADADGNVAVVDLASATTKLRADHADLACDD